MARRIGVPGRASRRVHNPWARSTSLEEVELQEEWTSELAAVQTGEGQGDAHAQEAKTLDTFMRAPLADDGPSRREALTNELQRSAVRKAVRHEIKRRTMNSE